MPEHKNDAEKDRADTEDSSPPKPITVTDGSNDDDTLSSDDEDEIIDLREDDSAASDELIDEEKLAVDSETDEDLDLDQGQGQDRRQETEVTDTNTEVDRMMKVDREVPPPSDPRAAQAAAAAAASIHAKESSRRTILGRVKSGFARWWHNARLRNSTLALLFVAIVTAALVPVSRYAILNTAGIRVGATVTISNQESGLPLENIPVKLAGKEVRTNEEGQAVFSGLKLGTVPLIIDKLGYAAIDKQVTLGLGSNPGVRQEIDATGAQYRFALTQWLSDAKVDDAKAISGEDVARVNDEGELLLTVSDLSPEAEVIISANGYREARLKVNDLQAELTDVEMVPYYQNTFVSNRSGEYDLYKIDVDGENEQLLLKATGSEREIPFVQQNEDGSKAAYISSRDGEENQDGFVLDGLYLIDVLSGESKRITRSEQLQIIGWNNSRLIYVAVVEGVSASNPQRSKIFSYDVNSSEKTEIASANYFNDVKLIGENIYYSVSSFAVPRSQAKLYSRDVEGKNEPTVVVDSQIWTIGFKDPGTLLFSGEDRQWFEQILSSGEVKKLDTAPPANAQRNYTVRGDKSLRVETRDGKGTLLLTDMSGKESVIATEAGIDEPIKWINDEYAIYRVSTASESADYIIRVDTGKTQKITDVVANRSRNFY